MFADVLARSHRLPEDAMSEVLGGDGHAGVLEKLGDRGHGRARCLELDRERLLPAVQVHPLGDARLGAHASR